MALEKAAWHGNWLENTWARSRTAYGWFRLQRLTRLTPSSPPLWMRSTSLFTASTIADARLLDYLRDREILLILDGFEQIDEERAQFLLQLLRAASSIVVIATSRERLNLREEWAYPVRGLDFALPDAATSAELVRSDAVTLFVLRAQQVDHHLR